MTVTVTKEFLLYTILFLMITLFGVLYMAQSHEIYNQSMTASEQKYEQNNGKVNNEQIKQNNSSEVVGIIK